VAEHSDRHNTFAGLRYDRGHLETKEIYFGEESAVNGRRRMHQQTRRNAGAAQIRLSKGGHT
jgi:hypothetical protein